MGEKLTFIERIRRFFVPKYIVRHGYHTLDRREYLCEHGFSTDPVKARRHRFLWQAWLAMDLMMEEYHLSSDLCAIDMIVNVTPSSYTLYPRS
jgi:hypothetical protein